MGLQTNTPESGSQDARPIVADGVPIGFEEIEEQVARFERAERRRLGLDEPVREPWHDANPKTFTRAQRDTTTILLGGLTVAQDLLVQAALEGLNYRIAVLDCPDVQALHLGKEFGNRGQCNPTYFTVGNLIKALTRLRDEEGLSVGDIVEQYVFLTAGACGPCRFGTYVTEYRKALRDAGFEGFRVLLFQQTGGLKQATGDDAGLELNRQFFGQILKALLAGDLLNAMGYRIRPYEVTAGRTDEALLASRDILSRAFRERTSILRALVRSRRLLAAVEVDRLRPKPKVTIIGEFWAMTTEGDGNHQLQRFLEAEGAEVDIQLVTAWILYLIWQVRHDVSRRLELRESDDRSKGLRGTDGQLTLAKMWVADKSLRTFFWVFAKAIGLTNYHLPDMDEIARLASAHYDVELRGGEGHMEVGKAIQAAVDKKAHMVLSVKPFGCMPSAGVSDGVQSAVMTRHPEAIFCPVETTGDGAVNFQSRILMFLFKARRQARAEFERVLTESGLTLEEARRQVTQRRKAATYYPPHRLAGTAANTILARLSPNAGVRVGF